MTVINFVVNGIPIVFLATKSLIKVFKKCKKKLTKMHNKRIKKKTKLHKLRSRTPEEKAYR